MPIFVAGDIGWTVLSETLREFRYAMAETLREFRDAMAETHRRFTAWVTGQTAYQYLRPDC